MSTDLNQGAPTFLGVEVVYTITQRTKLMPKMQESRGGEHM